MPFMWCAVGFRQVPPGAAAARCDCVPVAYGSAGLLQVPRWPIVPTGIPPHSYIPPPEQYQAFRNHRNVGYWGGRRKGEDEKSESGKTPTKVGFAGVIPPLWGFRGVPRLSIAPIFPFSVSSLPYSALPAKTRRFENTATLFTAEGRRKGENDKSESGKTPTKQLDLGA